MVAGIVRRIPEIVAAARAGGDVTKNVIRAIGVPMEMTFSTYANGLFFPASKT